MKTNIQRLLVILFLSICIFWLFITQIQSLLVLKYEQVPSKVDAIVVLGGGSGYRLTKAIELFQSLQMITL